MAFWIGTGASLVMSPNEVNEVQLFTLIIVPAEEQKLQNKDVKDEQPLALTEVRASWFWNAQVCKLLRPLISTEVRVGTSEPLPRPVITPLGVGLLFPAQAQKVNEAFAVTANVEPVAS